MHEHRVGIRSISHEKSDRVFERKCTELSQQVTAKIDRQREEISGMPSPTAAFIRDGQIARIDFHLLTLTINDLKPEIHKIEQISFEVRYASFTSINRSQNNRGY